MKQTTRILAIALALCAITPIYPLTINKPTLYGITGIGTLGGAALGVFCYQEMVEKRQDPQNKDKKKELKDESPIKIIKRYLPLIGSGLLGAAIGGIGLNRIFNEFTQEAHDARQRARDLVQEQARQAQERAQEQARLAAIRAREESAQNDLRQAQELIHRACDVNRLGAYIVEGIDGRTIEDRTLRSFDTFPLVYGSRNMREAEETLLQAQRLCRRALENANGNVALIQNCNAALQQIDQYIETARSTGAEIRRHPHYVVERDQEEESRRKQEIVDAKARKAQAAETAAYAEREKAQAAQNQVQATYAQAQATRELKDATLKKAASEQALAHANNNLAQSNQQVNTLSGRIYNVEQGNQSLQNDMRSLTNETRSVSNQLHTLQAQYAAINLAAMNSNQSKPHHNGRKKK